MKECVARVRVGKHGHRHIVTVVAPTYTDLLKKINRLYGTKAVVLNITTR